jgi:hypothetical protein
VNRRVLTETTSTAHTIVTLGYVGYCKSEKEEEDIN